MLCVILRYLSKTKSSLLRGLTGGEGLLTADLLRFCFFIYIFLVVVALSQGSSLLVLKYFYDNLASFGRSLKKIKKTPLNFAGLLSGVSETGKSVHGGPLLGRFFCDKKLLIVFFYRRCSSAFLCRICFFVFCLCFLSNELAPKKIPFFPVLKIAQL